MWHYSIDTCQTSVDVPMLEIRIVEGTGKVDMFDGRSWTHDHGAVLEFFDTRYAQSGWHNMTSEFVVEYYDGVGYDGEPLKVVDVAITTEQSDSTVWLNNLTPTGATPESPSPDATITEWYTYVYGQWDNKLVASWIVPNPSQDSTATDLTPNANVNRETAAATQGEPLAVLFQGSMFAWPQENKLDAVNRCMVSDGIYVKYEWQDYSLKRLVAVAEVISEVTGDQISTLAMNEHCNVNLLRIGCTTLSAPLFYSRGYDELFLELGGVLAPGAQIQFFGCNVAGPNPYDPAANWANVQNKVAWSNEYQAMEARSMLSAIAQITKATVFASSDMSGMSRILYNPATGTVYVAEPDDMALEFVVGSNGYQIPWSSTNPGGAHDMHPVWDTTIWSPAPRTADKGGLFQYSPNTTPTNIPTSGEEDNRYWPSTLRALWKSVYS